MVRQEVLVGIAFSADRHRRALMHPSRRVMAIVPQYRTTGYEWLWASVGGGGAGRIGGTAGMAGPNACCSFGKSR